MQRFQTFIRSTDCCMPLVNAHECLACHFGHLAPALMSTVSLHLVLRKSAVVHCSRCRCQAAQMVEAGCRAAVHADTNARRRHSLQHAPAARSTVDASVRFMHVCCRLGPCPAIIASVPGGVTDCGNVAQRRCCAGILLPGLCCRVCTGCFQRASDSGSGQAASTPSRPPVNGFPQSSARPRARTAANALHDVGYHPRPPSAPLLLLRGPCLVARCPRLVGAHILRRPGARPSSVALPSVSPAPPPPAA
jgi:hypothetical protein